MKFKFHVNYYGFSAADIDQLCEAAERSNARVRISFPAEEENEERVHIAETALYALIAALDQNYTFAMQKEGNEVAIDLHNDRPGRRVKRKG